MALHLNMTKKQTNLVESRLAAPNRYLAKSLTKGLIAIGSNEVTNFVDKHAITYAFNALLTEAFQYLVGKAQ